MDTSNMNHEPVKAVVIVVGKDMVGILAKVSAGIADAGANVLDVTQSVLDEYFCMIMIIDIAGARLSIEELQRSLESSCDGMKVHVMHEDIFNAMHRI